VGSIQKGQALTATGGGGKTVQCGVCHGADLKGIGFDAVAGYLEGGLEMLESLPDFLVGTERMSAPEVAEQLTSPGPPLVLDVRTPVERSARRRERSRRCGSCRWARSGAVGRIARLPRTS
jgi:mono/diheme cytochrome c family protein